MKKIYLLFIALFPVLAWGQILSWNLNGAAGNETSLAASSKDANLSASLLTRGAGITATALGNGFSSTGWNVATEALAISGNKYFQFTINASSGFQASLSTLDLYIRRSSTGPNAFQWQYSLDGFATAGNDVGAAISYTATTTNGDPQTQISLSGISALQNVAASTTITFRLYGWGASAAGGTFAIGRPAVVSSLSIGGTVTPASGTTPVVTATPSSLNGFSTVTGTASASQTFTVGGSNLTNDIAINFSSQYELSFDAGATYTSASPVTLPQTGGTVANTTLNIRIAASAPIGAANGNVTVSSTGATNQLIALTGTVNAGVTVNPPQSFSATAVSGSEIDLAALANTDADNIVVATNASATFGTPSGALVAGNIISGGGTVLYSGPSAGFSFTHTGLNSGTKYYYQAWSVNGALVYSTAIAANATTANPPAANVVINQVYGGGGNSGAYYKNDFIELYNNENTPVNLAGWSVQYTNVTGTSWTTTSLAGIIPAHSFFLVQEAAGANASAANLPTPDVIGTLTLGSTGGKVILCNSTAAQTVSDPTTNVIDKVGFGTANAYEGTGTAPVTDNTTSITRVTDGIDNNNNATDFALTSPVPRNTSYIVTPPAISYLTPPNGVSDIYSGLIPSIVFSKPIVKGASGTITIYENGVGGTPIDVNSASVAISNRNTVTINTTLLPGKSYYILVSAGAFADVYGNSFAGITTNTSWAFTTYNSAVAATLPVNFDFQNCTGTGLLPNGFTQYNVTGAQVWDCTAFGRDPAALAGTAAFPNAVQINGYANGVDNLNKDWLISPKLDLSLTNFPLLSFWSRNAFAGDPLELKISTNYTGSGDPLLATWTDLNGKFPSQGSDVWTQSGGINLSAFKQSSVYFAFVYTSTPDDGSRWTLDDINLINSSAPPLPSLTLSASNLEFGYTASGSSSDKIFTVIGNDLVGDITLTSTGNFEVSTDGTSFGPTATITQATANNIPQTIHVRFAPSITNQQFSETLSVAISDSTGVVSLKGNSIDPASTLNVVDWNLNWFATPNVAFGPPDKSLQQDNVAKVLKSIPADLFVLQEVVNVHALDSIVNTMPGYAYKVGNYGSYSNPNEPTASPLTEVQKLGFVYKVSKFSNMRTDSLLTKGVTTAADLGNPYYNAFASGRFPYMLTADVTLSDNNGGFITHTIRFINVHAKANTAPVLTSYDRRVAGAKGLDSLIRHDFANENVIVLGDFNDDLNKTITTGITPPVTSYYSFTIDHASSYIFPTMPLGPAGQHSDVNFANTVIDNVVATAATSKYYLPASATVLSDVANVVTKYGTTTTDHYPVFTQFSFSTAAALPVTLLKFAAAKENATVKVSWSTAQEVNSQLFDVEKSPDGNSFTKIGTVAAQGSSNIKVDYSFNDNQPLNGSNYYRLKQVDKDGKFVYSKVIKINFTKLPGIRISPNPASSYIYLSLENINSTVNLQLIDVNGKLVKQQLITQGTLNKTVSLGGMAKGLYTIKLVSQEQVSTQKLLIQ